MKVGRELKSRATQWVRRRLAGHSFYTLIRPAFVIHATLGFCSVTEICTSDVNRLKYKIFNIRSLFLYTVHVIFHAQRFLESFEHSSRLYSKALTLSSVALVFICIFSDRLLISIIQRIEIIDKNMKTLIHIKNINGTRVLRLYALYVLMISYILGTTYSHIGDVPHRLVRTALLFLVRFSEHQVYILFVFMCEELCSRYYILHGFCNHVIRHKQYWRFEDIRAIHLQLTELNEMLIECYAYRLTFMFLYITCQSIVMMDFVMKEITHINLHFMFSGIILYYYFLHSTTTAAENLARAVSVKRSLYAC